MSSQDKNSSTIHKQLWIFFIFNIKEVFNRISYIYLKTGISQILLYLPKTDIPKKLFYIFV